MLALFELVGWFGVGVGGYFAIGEGSFFAYGDFESIAWLRRRFQSRRIDLQGWNGKV